MTVFGVLVLYLWGSFYSQVQYLWVSFYSQVLYLCGSFIHRYCTCGVVFIHRYCTCGLVFIHRYCTCVEVFIHHYCTCGVALVHLLLSKGTVPVNKPIDKMKENVTKLLTGIDLVYLCLQFLLIWYIFTFRCLFAPPTIRPFSNACVPLYGGGANPPISNPCQLNLIS